MRNFYDELGVSRGCTARELQAAYRRRAQQVHPDKVRGSKEVFQSLAFAYETALDPKARAAYDQGCGHNLDDSIGPRHTAFSSVEMLSRASALRAMLGDCPPAACQKRIASISEEGLCC